MERAYSICGTIEYMAPEIVEGGESGHDKVSLNTAVMPTNIICLTEKEKKKKSLGFRTKMYNWHHILSRMSIGAFKTVTFSRRWIGGALAC